MNPNDYLNTVLAQQTFAKDAPEIKDLRARREAIAKTLREHFSDSPISTRWAGSMAKDTMISESYDGDVTCYFNHDDNGGGETLEDIYNNVEECLATEFFLERKASALRVREKTLENVDLHVDVVPGRFTDSDKSDVFLHRTTGDKSRLKTNLQIHIDHIKDSGVLDAIRLMKLWNVRNGVRAKTFVLELLVVRLLKGKKSSSLETQLKHIWTEFRDRAAELSVEDPANPNGNDLKPALDACRAALQAVATTTLWHVENGDWESVFGKVEESESEESKSAAFAATVSSVRTPTRPWSCG